MIPLGRIYSEGASLLRSRLYVSIVLLAFLTNGAVAQREVIYMAVLSSFHPRDKGDITPAAGLFVSTDQGHTWQHGGWRDYIRNFYSEEGSDGTVWSACGNGVLRSTNAGKTWRITTDWKVTEVLKVKAAETDPAIVFASTAYGIFRSTDKGASWEKKVLGMRRAYSGDVCIDRTNPQHVLAATEEGAYLSEDCGERWVAAEFTARECVSLYRTHMMQNDSGSGRKKTGCFVPRMVGGGGSSARQVWIMEPSIRLLCIPRRRIGSTQVRMAEECT